MEESIVNDFIVHSVYPMNVSPLLCVKGGSRAFGLSLDKSDHDFLGVHLMSLDQCLEHPDFRTALPVIREKYDENFIEIPNGIKGGYYSLDSFEIWKFLSLYNKSSFVTYELIYLPSIYLDSRHTDLRELLKLGLNSKLGKAAKGNALHDWGRHKTDRKRAVMAYYRLVQAIYFLREYKFEWNTQKLIEYIEPSGLIFAGKEILAKYLSSEYRTEKLNNNELLHAGQEISKLIVEVDKARMVTRLSDRCPNNILKDILQVVKEIRLNQMV